MAKTEGEWKSKTLKEFKASEHTVWRAQISTAPDGKKFAGVRKYVIKRDGTEIADRAGISFPFEADTIGDNVDALIELLQTLKGGTVRASSETEYVLVTQSGKFVKGRIKGKWQSTEDLERAKRFSSSTEAKAFRSTHTFLADCKVTNLSKIK
jgi:hypothetical protein